MTAIKTCLIGEAGVGKTTLTNLLKRQNLNGARKPTIGVNIEKVPLKNGNMCVWDLAGQRRFQFMWDEFLRGSELTIVVTDSTENNVELTKQIVQRHLKKAASKVIAIANKQDLEGRLPPEEIQNRLGIPTYGFIGINPSNEEQLRKIIEKHI